MSAAPPRVVFLFRMATVFIFNACQLQMLPPPFPEGRAREGG